MFFDKISFIMNEDKTATPAISNTESAPDHTPAIFTIEFPTSDKLIPMLIAASTEGELVSGLDGGDIHIKFANITELTAFLEKLTQLHQAAATEILVLDQPAADSQTVTL
jgi:hypothetical protein